MLDPERVYEVMQNLGHLFRGSQEAKHYLDDVVEDNYGLKTNVYYNVSGGLVHQTEFVSPFSLEAPLVVNEIVEVASESSEDAMYAYLDHVFMKVVSTASAFDSQNTIFQYCRISGFERNGQQIQHRFNVEELMQDEEAFKQALSDATTNGHMVEMKLLVKTRNNMFDYMEQARLEDGGGLRHLVVDSGESCHIPIKHRFELLVREQAPEDQNNPRRQFGCFERGGILSQLHMQQGVFFDLDGLCGYLQFYRDYLQYEVRTEINKAQIERVFADRLRVAQLKSDYGSCISAVYAERLYAQGQDSSATGELLQVATTMSMPAFKLQEAAKIFKLIAKVVKAYLDHKYPQFGQSA
jgi:hypothetical protein